MKRIWFICAISLVMAGCSGIHRDEAGSGNPPDTASKPTNPTPIEQQIIQKALAQKPGGNLPFPKKPGSEQIQMSVGGPYPGPTLPFEATSNVKKTDQHQYEVTFILSWKLKDVPHHEEDEKRPNETLSHQWVYEVDGDQVVFKEESGDRIPSIK